ncbi:integral membrane protein GPR155 isoform X1 [Strongylocentrotus purpuratus]|uniref:DEP domain-containing protein n=1 Tax=Strongylocentrotus purpuratus TaxID=7668 RepID=A0A7M7PF66_STRPU|nr:integral membrane protein GPR155 isoform X1 [Strongylocentrotus purpuratus]
MAEIPTTTFVYADDANTSTGTPATPNGTVLAFQNLIPALVQCFTIILFGYIAGRTRIVCPSQAKGLGHYVSYFALPAMLFKSMVELDFSEVNWLFFSSVLIAKAIVFTAVYIGTLVLGGSKPLGKAGLYSMFATQSNDFALGYPIVQALYSTSNPEMMQYIYIFAPINLLFLNPWGFLSLEVQKMSRANERRSKALVVWSVFKGLVTNPIFTTVFIGIIFNFALSQRLPTILDDILTSLANSFGATALFLLGVSMVGKVKQQSGLALVTPALLIASKLLVLPLLTNQLVYALNPGGSNQTLTDSYASFGFLYGSLPTAPTVFLYATHYQQSIDMIAPTMVYCTFVSAPFMFITATMVMIPMATEGQYHNALSEGAFDVSCLGLASAIWVFIIFLLRRKTSHFPHQFTANLIVAQALAAFGVILCHTVIFNTYWGKLVHFIIMLTGVFGARCWTAMVALSLFLLRYRSTCFVIKHRFWFYFYGWGIPVMTVGILVTVIPLDDAEVDVLYEIEKPQLVASIIILMLNLVVSLVSLIGLHRCDRFRRQGYQPILGNDSEEDENESRTTVSLSKSKQNVDKEGATSDDSPTPLGNDSPSSPSSSSSSSSCTLGDIEDLPSLNAAISRQMCGRNFGCSRVQSSECRRLLLRRSMRDMSRQEEEDAVMLNEAERHQLGRHILLLYFLVLSMLVAVSLCFWKLIGSSQSGIFLELSFLDCILNYGQGFMVLAIFGFDTENVIMPVVRLMTRCSKPFKKRVRRCIYGTEKVHLPRRDSLSPEVMQTCEQFKTHHLARCRDVIVTDRKYHLRTYKKVFRGLDLVDWLLEVGLAVGRSEATNYATRLLIGRILEHTHQEHHFHDNGLFFRFVADEEEGGGGSGEGEENGNDNTSDLMEDSSSPRAVMS